MENNDQKNKKIGIIIAISIVAIILILCVLGYEMLKNEKNDTSSEEKEPEKVISGTTRKTNSIGNELTAIESSTSSKANRNTRNT